MPLVEDVARGALAALGTNANYLLVAKFVNDRFKQIAGRKRLKSLRSIFSLSVPANIVAGTVSATRGSPVVLGDATAVAAWSARLIGRWIRPAQVWYEIAAVDLPNSSLVLVVPFGEPSVSGVGYTLAERFVPLDPTVRWIGDTMVLQRRQQPVSAISQEQLNALDPARLLTNAAGVYPSVFSEIGHRIDNVVQKVCKLVEIYPYSADTEVYQYIGYVIPNDLGLQDPLPPEIDEYVLREGVLADLMRHNMAQTLAAGDKEAAAHWRNEYRAQETRWEHVLLDAFRADGAVDDLTFILRKSSFTPSFDIVTARDEILARWPR